MLNGLNVCFRLDAAKIEEQASLARLCYYNHHAEEDNAKNEKRYLEQCRRNVAVAEYSLKLYKAWLKG